MSFTSYSLPFAPLVQTLFTPQSFPLLCNMYRDAHTPLMLNTLLAALAFILSTSSTVLVSAAPRCGLVVPTPPSLSAQTGSNGSGNSSVGDGMDVVATGWYPGWLGSELSPSQISWTKYSALTFAFA